MALVWVQLRSVKYIPERGQMQIYRPGDWVRVGKQTARQWIAAGEAWNSRLGELIPHGSGIMARGDGEVPGEIAHLGLTVLRWEGPPQFPRTLMWDKSLRLRGELLPVGFKLLDRWQVACPLWSYDQLAAHTGGQEDRARTEAVVRDLRVPLYNTKMIFLRRSADTMRLADLWEEEKRRGGDEKLAFLRALYLTKPVLCALPVSWARGKEDYF